MSPQELIKKSQNIGIALSQQAKSSDIIDALMLFCSLSKLGKNVRFEQGQGVFKSFEWLDMPALSTKTTVLSLKEMAPFVSKISYEKSERDLKLSFTLREGSLEPEHIEFEKIPETDLTFIVGENLPEHNQEITFNPHLRFWNPRKAFEASLSLLSPFRIPAIRLLQRSLLKLEYCAEQKLCIAPLEKRDFRETQTNSHDVRQVAEDLTKWGTFYSSYLIFFRSLAPQDEKIQGLLWTNRKELREKVLKSSRGFQKGNWALFQSEEKELKLAKEKILSLI